MGAADDNHEEACPLLSPSAEEKLPPSPPAPQAAKCCADGVPVVMGEPVGVPAGGAPRENWDSGILSCLGRNDEFCSSDLEVLHWSLKQKCEKEHIITLTVRHHKKGNSANTVVIWENRLPRVPFVGCLLIYPIMNSSTNSTQTTPVVAQDTSASHKCSSRPPETNISVLGFMSIVLCNSERSINRTNSSGGATQDFIQYNQLVQQMAIGDGDKLKGIPSHCSEYQIQLWHLDMPTYAPEVEEQETRHKQSLIKRERARYCELDKNHFAV